MSIYNIINIVHFQPNDPSQKLMEKLCKYIYAKDNTDRLRTRSILCQIYHHALHNRWFKARDLMLMSHLQDNIQYSDVPTQVSWPCFMSSKFVIVSIVSKFLNWNEILGHTINIVCFNDLYIIHFFTLPILVKSPKIHFSMLIFSQFSLIYMYIQTISL